MNFCEGAKVVGGLRKKKRGNDGSVPDKGIGKKAKWKKEAKKVELLPRVFAPFSFVNATQTVGNEIRKMEIELGKKKHSIID